MQPFIIEPERALPVWGEYEVVVVGGGMAGTAAVAAARHGARVCLVEKESAPGGLATLGNVVMYLFLCDGVGRRVVGGLGEEMLRLACREGAARLPECWQPGGDVQERRRTRYMATFAPAACLLALEAFILENGVDLWYDTRFCAAIREGRRIRALRVENKSGRGALLCKTVVDASGDADVCHQAGEETVSSRANVACGWIHAFDGSALTLHPLTRPFAADPEASGEDGFAGHTGSGVTAQILASRRLIRGHLEALRRPSPDSPLIPAYVPTIATVRMTRRLKGRRELRIGDAGRFLMTLSASPATKQPVGVRVQFSFRPGGRGERFVRPENGPTGRAGDHKDRPYRSDRIRQKLPLYSNGLLSGFPVGTCLRIAYEAPQQRRGNAVGAVFPHGSQAGDFVWKVAGRPSNAPDNWQRPRPLAIVLDNYSVHQSQSVQAQGSTLAAAGVTLFYWPAYAPELSAIEPLWTDVRYHQIPQRRYDLLGHRKSAVASALERKAKSLRAAQVKTDNLLPTPVQWLAVISQRPSRTRCLKVS